MKHLLLTTIAAVLVVGCGESQQSAPEPEAKPEPPTGKAPQNHSIHEAALMGKIELVKQHIAAGTDVNKKNKHGRTPLDLAIVMKKTETADLLRKHGGKTGAELKAEGK